MAERSLDWIDRLRRLSGALTTRATPEPTTGPAFAAHQAAEKVDQGRFQERHLDA